METATSEACCSRVNENAIRLFPSVLQAKPFRIPGHLRDAPRLSAHGGNNIQIVTGHRWRCLQVRDPFAIRRKAWRRYVQLVACDQIAAPAAGQVEQIQLRIARFDDRLPPALFHPATSQPRNRYRSAICTRQFAWEPSGPAHSINRVLARTLQRSESQLAGIRRPCGRPLHHEPACFDHQRAARLSSNAPVTADGQPRGLGTSRRSRVHRAKSTGYLPILAEKPAGGRSCAKNRFAPWDDGRPTATQR